MQKTFKRTLSLLLVVVMVAALFTALPITASAAEDTIAVGETKEISVSGRTYTYLKFVPDKDMIISFSSSSSEDTQGVICDANKDELSFDDDSGVDSNFRVTYTVTAGTTYYLGARFYSESDNGSFTVVLQKLGTPAFTEAPEIIGTSVTLDDFIRLNVYVDPKGNSCDYSIRDLDTEFWYEGDHRLQGLSELYDEYEVTQLANDIEKISIKVFAKEMADRFEIYLTSDSGNDTKVTSVKDYLETIIKNPEAYAPTDKADELKNLCCATLNYGYAAQVQFDHVGEKTITYKDYEYSEETVATLDIPAANQYLTEYPDIYTATETIEVGLDEGSQADFSDFGLAYYASSLGLFDNTSYAICFEETEYKNYSVYINDDYQSGNTVGQALVTTTDEDGYTTTNTHGMIAYYISEIPAKDILNDFEVTFKSYDDEWNEITKTVKFSPKTYIAKVIDNSGVTPDGYTDGTTFKYNLTYNTAEVQTKDNLAKTVAAIYDYSTRAAEYFN